MVDQPPTVTPVWPGVPLHPTVQAALRFTGGRSGRAPVDTRDVLVALMRADSSGAWHRIWLHTGDADAVAGKLVLDPNNEAGWSWENIPLTQTCAVALVTAWHLANRYNSWPISVGILAIGLIADESSAAAQALLDHELTRNELLDILQSDILGVQLNGLATILPTVLSAAQAPPPIARSSPAPATPVPAPVASDPEYWRRRKQVDIAVLVAAALMILVLSVAYAILHHPASHGPSSTRNTTYGSASTIGFVLDRAEKTTDGIYAAAEETR